MEPNGRKNIPAHNFRYTFLHLLPTLVVVLRISAADFSAPPDNKAVFKLSGHKQSVFMSASQQFNLSYIMIKLQKSIYDLWIICILITQFNTWELLAYITMAINYCKIYVI